MVAFVNLPGMAQTVDSAAALPSELAGVRIEPSVQVGDTSLGLNGAGIRYKFFIKVYTAALYTAARADSLEAILAQRGPKHLQITMLRDIDGNELGKLFTQGMERNTSRADIGGSINGMLRLGELFARRKKLAAGDNFSVDWLPGSGTQLRVNGRIETEVIREPEFFAALLGIWLGKIPADEDLKLALLGRTEKTDKTDRTEKRRLNGH
jgi:hypothetical protein